MRWGLLAGVLGLGACDRAFELTTVTPADAAAGDGTRVDASSSPLPCRAETGAPYFCADFDEAAPSYFQDGTMFPIQPPGGGNAPWDVLPPAVSMPNALHIHDTAGGQYYFEISPQHAEVTAIVASFDLDIASITPAAGATGFVLLETTRSSGSCSVQLQVNGTDLILQSHCSKTDAQNYATVLPGIPAGWNHVELTLEPPAGTASIAFGTRPLVSLDLKTTTPGGMPFLRLGAIGGATTAGPEVAYDNVVVTVR